MSEIMPIQAQNPDLAHAMAAAISGNRQLSDADAAKLIAEVYAQTEQTGEPAPLTANTAPVIETDLSRPASGRRNALCSGVAGLAMLAVACSNVGKSVPGPKSIAEVTAEACANSEFGAEINNRDNYLTTAFLPKASKPLTSKDDVSKHVGGWFDQDGPLGGGKIDTASLAAVTAVIVEPAHDGAAAKLDYNYLEGYRAAAARYADPQNGLASARKECAAAANTLRQTAELNPNWAQKGETVTRFVPVRDLNNPDPAKRNQIVGMKLEKIETLGTLGGIEFKLRDTSKKLDGFISVLVADNGDMFVKGFTVGEGGSAAGAAQEAGSSNESQQTSQGGSRGQQANNGGNQDRTSNGGGSGANATTGGGNTAKQKNGQENGCDGCDQQGANDTGNGSGIGQGGGNNCGTGCAGGGGLSGGGNTGGNIGGGEQGGNNGGDCRNCGVCVVCVPPQTSPPPTSPPPTSPPPTSPRPTSPPPTSPPPTSPPPTSPPPTSPPPPKDNPGPLPTAPSGY